MSWDNVYSWSQFLAVFFAGVALVSGFIVNKRQSFVILDLQKSVNESKTELAAAKTKQAKAEQSLLTFKNLVTAPRQLSDKDMDDVLKNGAKGSAEVKYVGGTSEAHMLALSLSDKLRDFGWHVTWPTITSDENAGDDNFLMAASTGILLKIELEASLAKEYSDDPTKEVPEPGRTLTKALYANRDIGRITRSVTIKKDSSKGCVLTVIVCPKY